MALNWLSIHQEDEIVRDQLLEYMVHLVLWQFRIDVLASIPDEEFDPELIEEARKGLTTFTLKNLELLREDGGEVHLISGNRSKFPQPMTLAKVLFGRNDDVERKHWGDRPYRMLHQRARGGLSTQMGAGTDITRLFKARLWAALFRHHWVLPVPHAMGLTQKGKKVGRMWYSVIPGPDTNRTRAAERGEPNYAWGRADARLGETPDLPRKLTWSREQWEGWIERRQATRSGEA
jgi:hypothetical protein